MDKHEKPPFRNQETVARSQWDKRYGEEQPYREKPATEIVNRFFKEHGDELQGEKILEIGCGNGRNLRHLAEQGYDTYGLEISEEAVKQIQEDFKKEGLAAEVQRGSFYNTPYKDERFGCVMSINVFQHNDWEGAERAFQEASRVLKNNGLLLLSVRSTSRDVPENREDVPDKGITFIPKQGTKEGIKLHHFSEEEIRELAQKNSLEVVEIQDVIRERQQPTSDGTITKGNWQVVFKKKTDSAE